MLITHKNFSFYITWENSGLNISKQDSLLKCCNMLQCSMALDSIQAIFYPVPTVCQEYHHVLLKEMSTNLAWFLSS